MSIKKLKQYIENIESNKPIDLQKFIALIQQFSLSHQFKNSDISARKLKGKFYQVSKMNDELVLEIKALTNDLGWDRESSARQNKSHQHKVDGSILLVRQRASHPVVVLIDKDGQFCGLEPKNRSALLVENRQNFIAIERTLKFLKEEAGFDQDTDIIFTSGNEISNKLHKVFLSYYEQLYLFFDLDLGGLMIAKNVNDLLPNTPKEFLVPHDIKVRLSKVVERQPTDYLNEVIKIGGSSPFLAPYAKLIKDYNCTLEQESYLYEE